MAKKVKKTVRKAKAPKPASFSLREFYAVRAHIPWAYAAECAKRQVMEGSPDWERTVAAESARLSFLWADAMLEHAAQGVSQ